MSESPTFSKDSLPGVPRPWARWRKKHLTEALRVQGSFTVVTREGTLTCADGWLAIDSEGWPYPIAADEFRTIYDPVKTGVPTDDGVRATAGGDNAHGALDAPERRYVGYADLRPRDEIEVYVHDSQLGWRWERRSVVFAAEHVVRLRDADGREYEIEPVLDAKRLIRRA